MGQCPACGQWETLTEQSSRAPLPANAVEMARYGDIAPERLVRFASGFGELDRVLGGGFVPGSLVLLGGDPGIGKSTLMLQVAAAAHAAGKRVLYVSGEESHAQIKMRGERLGLTAPGLMLLAETQLEAMEQAAGRSPLDLIFIDSIQTMYTSALPSGPGSVSQVREVTSRLLLMAKSKGVTIVLIGHITKDGQLAGPKTLEHMVDGVFYFEGDKYHQLRMIRSQKNRFGPAQELGIFRMTEAGLAEVANPSEVLLEQRPKSVAGSVVVPCIEGTRPIMIEIQVLLSTSTYASPRRVAMGVDGQRLALIMAVLEKKAGLQLQGLDVFVNVAGGLTVQEPAIDLGLGLAVYSAFRNLVLAPDTAVFGELGLAGEVRGVSQAAARLKECRSLGFARVICPRANASPHPDGMTTAGVDLLVEALEHAL